MAIHKIQGPDGRIHKIEGPEDADPQVLMQVVANQLAQQASANDAALAFGESYQDPDFIDYIEETGKGIIGGAINMGGTAVEGAAGMLGADADTLKSIERGTQAVSSPFRADRGSEEIFTRKLGEGLGSMATMVGATLINPYLGGAVAVTGGAGEAAQRAVSAGASDADITKSSWLGVGPGALEMLPISKFIRAAKALETIPDAMTGVQRIKRAAGAGGIEAAQEAASNLAQNLIERGVYNPERGTLDGSFDSITVGGGVGAITQLLLDMALGRRSRGAAGDSSPQEEELVPRDTTKFTQPDLFGDVPAPVGPAGTTFSADEWAVIQEQLAGDKPREVSEDQLDLFDDKGIPPVARLTPSEVARAQSTAASRRELEGLNRGETTDMFGGRGMLPEGVTMTREQAEAMRDRERNAQGDLFGMDGMEQAQPDLFALLEAEQRRGTTGDLFDEANVPASRPDRAKRSIPAGATMSREEAEAMQGVSQAERDKAEKQKALEEATARKKAQLEAIQAMNAQQQADQRAAPDAVQMAMQPRDRAQMELFPGPQAGQKAAPMGPPTAVGKPTPPRQVAEGQGQLPGIPMGRNQVAKPYDAPTKAPVGVDAKALEARRAQNEQQLERERKERADTQAENQRRVDARQTARDTLNPMRDMMNQDVQRARQTGQATPTGQTDMFGGAGPKQTTPKAPTTPRVIDDAMMDEYGLPKSLPLRKRIKGKDLSKPEDAEYVREQLRAAAKGKLSETAKAAAQRMLDGISPDQMNLFAQNRRPPNGPETDAGTTGNGPRGNGPDSMDGTGRGAGKDTSPAKPPVGRQLGRNQQPASGSGRGTTGKSDTLAAFKTQLKEADKATTKPDDEPPPPPKGGKPKPAPKKKAPAKSVGIAKAFKPQTKKPAKSPLSAAAALSPDELRTTSELIAMVDDDKTGLPRPRRDTYEGKPLTPKERVQIYHRELVLNEWTYDQPIDPNTEYTGFFAEEAVSENDLLTIIDLERDPQTKRNIKLNPAKAARKYFTEKVRAIDAMVDAAYDLVNPKDTHVRNRALLTKEWINDNLSDNGKLLFAKLEAKFTRELEQQAKADRAREKNTKRIDDRLLHERKMREARQQQAINEGLSASTKRALMDDTTVISDDTIDMLFDEFEFNDIDLLRNRRENSEAIDLSRAMHPQVLIKIANGDLKGALQMLAETTSNKRVARTAKTLADKIGETKIYIFETVVEGEPDTIGAYLPREDTVLLKADGGLTAHNLLHEVTHALTAKAIRQYPNSPSVKYLNQLFNKLKGKMEGDYAFKSLDEFVAEAFSNPDFQRKLAAYDIHGNLLPVTTPTVWQKFKEAVVKLMRQVLGKAAPITNADQSVDAVISQILTPQGTNFDLDALYNEDGGIRDTGTFKPDYTPAARTRLKTIWERTDRAGRPAFLSTLPLNALADFIRMRTPAGFHKFATQLDNIVRRQTGDLGKRMEQNEKVLKEYVHKWYKNAKPEEHRLFNDVVADSTINQVDPTLTPVEAKKKYDNEHYNHYLELKGKFDSLSPAAKAAYKVMRNHYRNMYDEIVEVLGARLGADESGRRIFQEAMEIINKSGRIEPYFPLARKGDYVVTYFNRDNGEVYHESFEYDAQRQEAIAELKRMPNVTNIDQFIRTKSQDFKAAPPGSFVHQLNKVLTNGDVDADVRDQVMRLYMDSLPERSMLHGFRKRQGILGFERNAVKVFEEKTNNFSHQISHMKFGNELMQLEGEMSEGIRAEFGNDQEVQYFADELGKRIKFAKNPTRSAWSRNASSAIFHLTLGANISSAIIQMAQIPIMIAPYLGPKYGYANTIAAFEAARKLYMGNGFKQDSVMLDEHGKKRKVTTRSMFGIDNYDFSDPNLPADVKKYKTLVEVAKEHGQLHRSIIFDMLDVDAATGTWNKLTQWSGMMMHQAERFNRHMALTAAYNLEVKAKEESLGRNLTEMEQRDAAMVAIDLVELTNGSSQAAGAPRILQGDIGSVLGMYKRYGITMLYAQMRTAAQMFSKDPDTRKLAMKQIAGMYGMAAAIAGIGGVPFYGVIATIADLFGDDGEEDFDSMVRKQVGDWAFFGLPSKALGVDVASRIGMTDLIFRDPYRAYDKTALEIGVDLLGGPGVSILKNLFGPVLDDFENGNYQRGFEGAAPAAIRSGLKALRYGQEDALTRRGDLVAEMTGGDIMAQMIGFTPLEFALKNKQNAIVGELNRVAGDDKRKLTKLLYVSMRMGDAGGVQKAMQGIAEYNQRFPSMAITQESIRKSLESHQRTTSEMRNGLRVDQRLLPEVIRLESGYW